MCHIGQTFSELDTPVFFLLSVTLTIFLLVLLGSLQHGSCVIQPTAISFSSEELIQMIHDCGLNRLNQFAAFLAGHLRKSREDAKLLSMLAGLDEVLYSGLPLPHEEETWAYTNGINLKVSFIILTVLQNSNISSQNLFGSTECGAMMLSIGGKERNAPFLRPIEGTSYEFRPAAPVPEAGHQSTARLLELIILKESRDCPDASLRHLDGDFHTGDLFQEAAPGSYVFRGRDDDWIKSETSLRCDTKFVLLSRAFFSTC